MEKIKIGLVDDQLLFRQGLAALINSVGDFLLVMEADDGNSCLSQLQNMEIVPDIILMDMEMPGMDGMELNEILHKKYPGLKVIVVSVHASERLIARMIDAGASGYLVKNCDKDELVTAINTVFSTGFYINNNVLKAIQHASHARQLTAKNFQGIPVELTAREKEILQMICRELTAPEIAEQLFLSTRTVEGHRNNLLLKTGCKNTAGLVLFAVKHHIYEVVY